MIAPLDARVQSARDRAQQEMQELLAKSHLMMAKSEAAIPEIMEKQKQLLELQRRKHESVYTKFKVWKNVLLFL